LSNYGGHAVDPALVEASSAVAAVLSGEVADRQESQTLDFKEDKSRRGPGGEILEGSAEHEETAKDLAEAAACLANRTGGVVVVGVADRIGGEEALRGTALDESWLARRVHQLTVPSLTVTVLPWLEQTSGARLLLVRVPEPPVAIAYSGRYKHRVGRDCVIMSAAEVAARSGSRDWSGEPSALTADDIDAAAADAARTLLRRTGDATRARLANFDDAPLVRALLGMAPDGRLSRAGALMFGRRAGTDRAHVDVTVRRAPGSASIERLDAPGRSLAVELVDAFAMLARYTQRPGAVSGAVRVSADRLPDAAVREALVNACVHRDWSVPSDPPVSVDLVGDVLVVVSPGGFPLGVTEANVVSTPSRPRNRALADLARAMRLAEQEGTGVDRMCRELIFRGLPRPELQETSGMNVRCALLGGAPVPQVVDLVSRLDEGADEDTDIALILDQLLREPRINTEDLPRLLQKTRVEAASALRRAAQGSIRLLDLGLVSPAEGPAPKDRWWRLSDAARAVVQSALPYPGARAVEHARWAVWLARQAGQVRAADLRDNLGVTATQASRALTQALEDGDLAPGSASTRGRGVRYLPAG